MTFPAVFVDTWGWVALGRKRETRHDEVVRVYQDSLNRKLRICTSDFILDEMVTLLFRRERFEDASRFVDGIFRAASSGRLVVERVTESRFEAAWALRARYQDKPLISFTDLTSIVIMNELGVSDVLTEDEHFLHVGMGFRLLPS